MATDAKNAQPVVPEWFQPWSGYEQEATELRYYGALLVPGVVQTEDYAMVLLQDSERVAARIDRQGIVDRAKVTVVVAERALREPIGGPDVMARQLESLTATQAVVRVLPVGADTRWSCDGAFALAVVDSTEVGFIDGSPQGRVTLEPGVLSDMRQRWEDLIAEALPRTLSQALILKEAERWRTDTG